MTLACEDAKFLRLFLLLKLMMRIELATVCCRFGSWGLVIKLNFCSDLEHFGQDFEVEVQARFWSWSLVSILLLVYGLGYKHCQRHNGPEGWVHLAKDILQVQTQILTINIKYNKFWAQSIILISVAWVGRLISIWPVCKTFSLTTFDSEVFPPFCKAFFIV